MFPVSSVAESGIRHCPLPSAALPRDMKALKSRAKVNEVFYQYVVEPNKARNSWRCGALPGAVPTTEAGDD